MKGEVPRYWLSSVPALMPEYSVRIRTSFGASGATAKSSNASCRTAVSISPWSPTDFLPRDPYGDGICQCKRFKLLNERSRGELLRNEGFS